jgi:hypothetical protein
VVVCCMRRSSDARSILWKKKKNRADASLGWRAQCS